MIKKCKSPDVVAWVDQKLDVACRKRRLGFKLRVVDQEVQDEWLNLYVSPGRKRVPSDEYVRVLAQVEEQAEDEFKDLHLLLVPA
jgi:hypothetical protein